VSELDLSAEARDAAQAQARGLMVKLTLCLKLATMHHLSNQALKGPVAALVQAVKEGLSGADQLLVQVVGENVFLNKEIIRLDATSFEAAATLRQMTTRLGVNEIGFVAAPGDDDVFEFLAAFQRHYGSRDPRGFREEKFRHLTVRVINAAAVGLSGVAIDERQNLLRCYALLALNLEQSAQRLLLGREPRIVAVRRALQGLAEASRGLDSLLVGITRFPSMRGQPHLHLASVAALTLLLGKRLGLSRGPLVDLALAAAFHDAARLQGGDDGAQQLAVKSGLALAKVSNSTDGLARAAVALELPLPCSARTPMAPSMTARLIAVPCAFEAMTSAQPPQVPLPPDLALRSLMHGAPERYDARAVKLFTSLVGLYPVGTTVQLESGELAVVVEAPADPRQLARPRLKVIRDAGGNSCDVAVDLAAEGETRAIAGAVEATSVDVSVPDLLLA